MAKKLEDKEQINFSIVAEGRKKKREKIDSK
jgi:hypothetical protein